MPKNIHKLTEDWKRNIGEAQKMFLANGGEHSRGNLGKLGKKRSEEIKIKMSKSAIKAGIGKWNKGKKRTLEARLKMGLKGEKNGFWNGGKIDFLKRQAKIRDDYTCQICGLKDSEIMEVDHKISKSKRPDLQFDIDNLWILCPNCHRRKTNKELKKPIIFFD